LIWDLQTQQLLHHLTMDERLDSLTFSADDKYLAVAGATPVVRVFDVTSGRQTASLMAPGKSVTETAFAPDGRWLATSGTDGTVRVFRSGQDSRGTRISTGQDEMPALAFDADRPELRTAAWNAHRGMSTWDANTGERLQHFSAEFNREHKWPRGDYAFSTDGRRLAAARHDNPQIVTVWDAVSGQELISLAEHPGFVRAVAFSRDDALLATAAVEKTGAELCIWNAATGELIRTQDVGKVLVSAIAFSHDGKSVATGGQPTGTEPGVSIWDAGTGAARFHFDGPALVFGLAFSPDGGRLAAADYGRQRVSVWDAERGEPIGEMPGIAAVSDVAWSPDGTRLAAIGYDANVHLLDGETLEELIVLRTLGPPSGTMGFTPRVAFSPDGSKIAGNSPHGTVTVWDADDGNTEPFRFPAPRPAGSGNSGRDPDNDRE
jgi:WD40 repeat protein